MNLKLELDEEKIMEENNINNLYNLTNNLIKDMDEKNTQNKFNSDYYESIMETLGLKNIKKTTKKIKERLNIEEKIEEKEEENKVDNNK